MKRDDRWLWDRSGEPDRDVERLERALGTLAETPPEPVWPATARRPRRGPAWAIASPALAAAAALAVLIGAPWLAARQGAWSVETLAGRPRLSGWTGAFARLGVGGELRTHAGDAARVAVGDIGWLDVGPHSVVRLVQTEPGRRRVALERGVVAAVIVAPPRTFVVDTPSGVATDLGCAYRLAVTEGGDSELAVTAGWVAFSEGGLESFVPAGAVCFTRRGAAPGTPRASDASGRFVRALEAFDAGRVEALGAVLEAARTEDRLTLWHLLARTHGGDRAKVAAALEHLVPRPASVSLDDVLALRPAAVDAWWDALGYGSSEFWRAWEGDFPGAPVRAPAPADGKRRG